MNLSWTIRGVKKKTTKLARPLCHFQSDAIGVKNETHAIIIFPHSTTITVWFLCPSFDYFSCLKCKEHR